MHDSGRDGGGGSGGASAGRRGEKMEEVRAITRASLDIVERKTLCLSGEPGETIHKGDAAFESSVRNLYGIHESTAAERLIQLKAQLLQTKGDAFWSTFTKELAHILGAQYTIVAKRVLPHDPATALEMPKFGEPGSCFSAVSMYFTNGEREEHTQGFDYPVQGSLCAHMQHDKVFLVPSHLADFIKELSANFEVPVESHFAIPLRDDDARCFAHVGVFWSVEGEKARKLSWGFIEMMLHSVEDILARRLLRDARVTDALDPRKLKRPSMTGAPMDSMHSLKPFARSLSHELRTPLHGVVGMLDLMYLTVQETQEGQASEEVTKLLQTLKGNIETIQDSSRRAVEAADNLSHAYDFDMQVPERMEGGGETTAAVLEAETVDNKDFAPVNNGERPKRRRSDSLETAGTLPSPKYRFIEMPPRSVTPNIATLTPHTATLKSIIRESSQITEPMAPLANDMTRSESDLPFPTPSGAKSTRVRDILRVVVNESLRFGGRPDSAIASETEFGEYIEVRNRGSNGHASTKMIVWSVEPSVPDEILMDERDFAKLVSVLFLNALKFTEQGSVGIHVSLSPRSRFVVISVTDTGSGIPAEFRPYLFQAFARGDDSLTRHTEGLGLGLMVAKSLARRVGGDLVCVRSDTHGPDRGSEFELRIPLAPLGSSSGSRSRTPSRTPTPVSYERSVTPNVPTMPDNAQVPTNGQNTAEVSPTSTPHISHQRISPTRDLPPLVPSPAPVNQPTIPDMAGTPRRLSQSLGPNHDRTMGKRYPLNVLVAEDNKINRKLLVNMLSKLGYTQVHEAFDGAEAVRLMEMDQVKPPDRHIDVILMDLWMPHMDGYEAARRILAMHRSRCAAGHLRILAVTADVTDVALDRARAVGMHGIMTKPYKLMDLEKLILEFGPPAKVGTAY